VVLKHRGNIKLIFYPYLLLNPKIHRRHHKSQQPLPGLEPSIIQPVSQRYTTKLSQPTTTKQFSTLGCLLIIFSPHTEVPCFVKNSVNLSFQLQGQNPLVTLYVHSLIDFWMTGCIPSNSSSKCDKAYGIIPYYYYHCCYCSLCLWPTIHSQSDKTVWVTCRSEQHASNFKGADLGNNGACTVMVTGCVTGPASPKKKSCLGYLTSLLQVQISYGVE
jgi:hypothetical protein